MLVLSRLFLPALLLVMLVSTLAMAQVPQQPGQVPGNPQAPQNPGAPPPGGPAAAAPAVDPDAGVAPLPYLVAFGTTLIFLTIVCMPSRKL
jgi:hypothetical protein